MSDLQGQLTLEMPDTVIGKKKAQRLAKGSQQLVKMVEEEELADYYVRCYRIASLLHARIGDWSLASQWASESHRLSLMADQDAVETEEMKLLAQQYSTNQAKERTNAARSRE